MNYEDYAGRGTDKYTGALRPLTYLPNTSEWVKNILCLEAETNQYTADEVLGGLYGIDNAPAQALANRTEFVRLNLVRLGDIVQAMISALEPMLTTIKKLRVQEFDVDIDYTHEAWLSLGNSPQATTIYTAFASKEKPSVQLIVETGVTRQNPTFEMTLENGRVIWLRTDGTTSIVPNVDDILDPDAIGEEQDQ